MVTKEFVKLTDKIIAGLKELTITGNGNVLIAKPPVEERTQGGLYISDGERELEHKKRGFGRVLSIPVNLNPEAGDLDLRPGDYVFYTWTAENPVNREQLGALLGVSIPKEMLAHTQDAEIILQVDPKKVPVKD